MVYDTNAYLTQDQMTTNGQYILNLLLTKGWTKNAICAMLGNMQTESTINFGIWESLDSSNLNNGFGLVQWTPSTKYTDWASANGFSNDHVNGELNRLLYELANNIQWVPDRFGYSPMTFQEFTVSTDTPENLAYVWMYNYEAPSNLDQPNRKTQARSWFDTLTGGEPIINPSNKTGDIVRFLLSGTLNGW